MPEKICYRATWPTCTMCHGKAGTWFPNLAALIFTAGSIPPPPTVDICSSCTQEFFSFFCSLVVISNRRYSTRSAYSVTLGCSVARSYHTLLTVLPGSALQCHSVGPQSSLRISFLELLGYLKLKYKCHIVSSFERQLQILQLQAPHRETTEGSSPSYLFLLALPNPTLAKALSELDPPTKSHRR
jgi:hypothetical protein